MTAPEVPHADLIARLRGMARNEVARDPMGALTEAADALAALGDTVPREHYDREALSAASFERALRQAEDQRAEARAERDALAHFIEQVRETASNDAGYSSTDVLARIDVLLAKTPDPYPPLVRAQFTNDYSYWLATGNAEDK